MSLMGYFARRQCELKMPANDGADEAGIRSDGKVLTGRESVERTLALDGVRRRGAFARLEAYDAVLRAHCRFDKEG
jgi:hypothetical protein